MEDQNQNTSYDLNSSTDSEHTFHLQSVKRLFNLKETRHNQSTFIGVVDQDGRFMSPKLPQSGFKIGSAVNMLSAFKPLDKIESMYADVVCETEPGNRFVTLKEFQEQVKEVFMLRKQVVDLQQQMIEIAQKITGFNRQTPNEIISHMNTEHSKMHIILAEEIESVAEEPKMPPKRMQNSDETNIKNIIFQPQINPKPQFEPETVDIFPIKTQLENFQGFELKEFDKGLFQPQTSEKEDLSDQIRVIRELAESKPKEQTIKILKNNNEEDDDFSKIANQIIQSDLNHLSLLPKVKSKKKKPKKAILSRQTFNKHEMTFVAEKKFNQQNDEDFERIQNQINEEINAKCSHQLTKTQTDPLKQVQSSGEAFSIQKSDQKLETFREQDSFTNFQNKRKSLQDPQNVILNLRDLNFLKSEVEPTQDQSKQFVFLTPKVGYVNQSQYDETQIQKAKEKQIQEILKFEEESKEYSSSTSDYQKKSISAQTKSKSELRRQSTLNTITPKTVLTNDESFLSNPQLKTIWALRDFLGINEEKIRNFLYQEKNAISQPQNQEEKPFSKLSGRLGNELSKKFIDSLLEIKKEQFGFEGLFNFDVSAIVQLALSKAVFKLIQKDNRHSHELNKHLEVILKHTQSLLKIQKLDETSNMELHFTFMFASPLVMTLSKYADQNQEIKHVPQLNHIKEFNIIKEKMQQSKMAIRYAKRQCTVESIVEIISQKPLGMHFSGHGIQLSESLGKDFYEENKDKGDFLLLETSNGDSQLVNRDQIKKIIQKAECNLEFVVVLTCHSQFVGEIFLQAGAKHVICIHQDYEVADEAAMTFTDTFYSSVFQHNMEICRAFEFAREIVGIKHGEEQEKIFLLLVYDKTQKDCLNHGYSIMPGVKKKEPLTQFEIHTCSGLPFRKKNIGECQDISIEKNCLQVSECMCQKQDLHGRWKEVYEIVSKILSPSCGKIYTVWGQHGIGKTAVVKAAIGYVNERKLIQGGFTFIRAKGIQSVEMFIRHVNTLLVKENPHLFGSSNDIYDFENKDCTSFFQVILSRISQLQKVVVFVIDGCDLLVEHDRTMFKYFLKQILFELPCKIILTTTMRLNDHQEDISVIGGLSPKCALNFFKEHANRVISTREQNELMKIKPDLAKYPHLKWEKVEKLHDHHLFKLIGGNPQSILLVAPMLNDPIKSLSLADLYHLYTSDKMTDLIDSNIEINSQQQQMSLSMRLSFEAAFNNISNHDPEALKLFFMISMFPGGLSLPDLDQLWMKQLNQQTIAKDEDQHKWMRAFNKLQTAKMIMTQRQDNEQGEDVQELELQEDSLIIMPAYLENFVQCQLNSSFDDTLSTIEHVIVEHLLEVTMTEYRNYSKRYIKKKTLRQENAARERFVTNMGAFYERMSDKFGFVFGSTLTNLLTQNSTLSQKSGLQNIIEEIASGKQQDKEEQDQPVFNEQFFKLKLMKNTSKLDDKKVNVLQIGACFLSKLINNVPSKSKATRLWQWAYQRVREINRRDSSLVTNRIKFEINDSCSSDEDVAKVKSMKADLQELDKEETVTRQRKPNKMRAAAMAIKFSVGQVGLEHRYTRLRVGTRKSMGFDSDVNNVVVMKLDEMVAVFHIAGLFLAGMNTVALQIIEKHLSKLRCSALFHGNITRYQALCMQSIFLEHVNQFYFSQGANTPNIESLKEEYLKIKQTLEKSLSQFTAAKCDWGIGLVKFQQAQLDQNIYLFKIDESGRMAFNRQAGENETFVRSSSKLKNAAFTLKNSLLLASLDIQNDKTVLKIIKRYAEGQKYFNKMGHLRGISLCTKGLMKMWRIYQELKGQTIKFDSDSESGDEHGFKEDLNFYESSDDQDEELQEKKKNDDIQSKVFKLKKIMHDTLMLFNRKQTEEERDSCLSRLPDEEYSLLTEISKSSSVKMLFDYQKRSTMDILSKGIYKKFKDIKDE